MASLGVPSGAGSIRESHSLMRYTYLHEKECVRMCTLVLTSIASLESLVREVELRNGTSEWTRKRTVADPSC